MSIAADRPNRVHCSVDTRNEHRVATVSFDNRTRLNTLNPKLIAQATEVFAQLSSDHSLRAVVVTGVEDRAFIGGADVTHMASLDAAGAREFISSLQRLHQSILDIPVPVVGRINGFSLGAGMELAACCDFRIASTNARFGMPEVHVGIPSVIEAVRLPMLIGWGRTRELLLTGRWIDAEEALRIGMVEQVVAPDVLDTAVGESLDLILRAAPGAVRTQKALIDHWEELSLKDGVAAGIDAFESSWSTDEPETYMRAFINRPR